MFTSCIDYCNNSIQWEILYTAFNLPSLIFTLPRSKTDQPILEFAHFPILLHSALSQLAQF